MQIIKFLLSISIFFSLIYNQNDFYDATTFIISLFAKKKKKSTSDDLTRLLGNLISFHSSHSAITKVH